MPAPATVAHSPSPTRGLAEETVQPDEAAVIASLLDFLKKISLERNPTGTIRRFNQGRAAGCVTAEFTVLDNLSPDLRVGLFARSKTYPAWIRFANASSASDRERDVRGMAIQLSGVEVEANLTPGAMTQDFVLNSHPVMVAPDTKQFFELLQAMEAGGLRQAAYFLAHPRAALIGLAARQHPSSHLDIPYWSTTPYLFGPDRAVKYIVRPCSTHTSVKPSTLTDTYLRDALRAHLATHEACFDFLVQFQRDPGRMPIEDATVEWKEEDSPYQMVANIRIPSQAIDDAARATQCEAVGFNPWHCLPDHRPLGSMNRARREIYPTMARFRHERV
jgi:hypothetical protein